MDPPPLFLIPFSHPHLPSKLQVLFSNPEIFEGKLVGGFNPSEKYWSKWITSPIFGLKIKHTPPKFNMKPENDGFQRGIYFSGDFFSGSMLNFGGVFETTIHKIWLLQVVSFSAFIRACASHAMIRPRK